MITIMSPLSTSEEQAPSSPLSTPEEPAPCSPEFLVQRSIVSPTVATTEVAKASNPTQVEAKEVRLSDLAPMMLDDTDVQTMLSVGCPLLPKFPHHLVVLESRDGILSSAAAKPPAPLVLYTPVPLDIQCLASAQHEHLLNMYISEFCHC
ncbi:uncharacterized protein [Triticum aestivum]|uniref:uncharacterized protein n=1 Tax=Triticum aestivum TaxID=4565 RepID=UPI001D0095DE|nr:uncharacterized protein LOC123061552 [Triticum aestivum]